MFPINKNKITFLNVGRHTEEEKNSINNDRKCKYLPLHCCEWLDDKVPENLHNAIYDLDNNGGYRKLIVPNREKH